MTSTFLSLPSKYLAMLLAESRTVITHTVIHSRFEPS
jgi:hypothetical protein